MARYMDRRIAIAALASLALSGCETLSDIVPGNIFGAAPAVPASPPVPPDPQAQMAPLEGRIATLIEAARENLDPKAHKLVLDAELSRIARQRAQDMATKNYLAHAAPNGDTAASLLMAEDDKWQGLLGENLAAQHYTKESGVDVEQFAQRFLETWMNSAPHRDNLAYAQYDHTGVGAAVNGDTVYVAQLFGTDLGLPPRQDGAANAKVTRYDNAAAAQADKPTGEPLRLRGAIGGGLPPPPAVKGPLR